MLSHIKELVVVLVVALAVFAAAKSLCLKVMRAEDFSLRRNVWIFLTVCAFLSPSFWLYAITAFVLLAWAARKDSNPVALFLVAYAVIPPVSLYIPVPGLGQFFALNQSRILALAVLLPVAFQLFVVNEGGLARKWTLVDWLLVAFMILQLALVVPYEAYTNTMRRGFLFVTDILLVYYVFSRSVANRRVLVDAMAAYTLSAAVYAALAIFESSRGWLLYEQIGPGWGASNLGAFLLRGDSLRAQVSAGHSLKLGYFFAVAFGMWLYLRTRVESRTARWLTTALLCMGLYTTHSRGPWLTGVVVYFLYLLLSPHGKSAFFKGLVVFMILGAAVSVTPIGTTIMDTLPFIGTVDQGNVSYRLRLAEESWRLIWQNPVFGDPFVAERMEDLRQGQGIIDLMNAYAATALFYGVTGLALFVAFLCVPAGRGYAALRRLRSVDDDLSAMGAALVACMLASLFFMATASVDWVEYVVAGLLSGYAFLASRYASAQGTAATFGASRPTPDRRPYVFEKS